MLSLLLTWLLLAPADDLRAAIKQSVASEKSQNYEQALAALTAVAAIQPNHYLLNARLGYLSLLTKNYADAEKYYQLAVKTSPKATEAWLGLASALLAQNKWAEAEATARKILAAEPQNYYAKLRLEIAYRQQQKHQEAATVLQQLLQAYPADLSVDQEYKALAKASLTAGQVAKPAEVFDERTEAAWQASLNAEQKGQWDDAIKALADVHKTHPKSYQLAVRLGWLHCNNRDYKTSESFYDQALKLAPLAIEAKLGRLSPLLAQARYADVETQANQVLKADPHNYYGLYWYVLALRLQNKTKVAEPYAERLAAAYPSDAKVLLELALNYNGQPQRKTVMRDLLQQILTLDSDNATAAQLLKDSK